MQYHDEELDFLSDRSKKNDPDFRVVRTYRFEPGAYRRRSIKCDIWFPDWPEDMNKLPAMIIQFELEEPAHVDICKNRLHVWCHWSVPSAYMIQEVERFFQTIKQMYSL